jgi:hypothetical protein
MATGLGAGGLNINNRGANTTHSSSIWDWFYVDCGLYLFIGHIFPKKSLVARLPPPLKFLASNPVITIACVLVIYPLLSLLIFPFYLLSYLITSTGSWFTLLILFIVLIRYFAVCMICPGSLPSLERKISRDYLKGMSGQFEKISLSASTIATSLVHAATGMSHSNISLKIDELHTLSSRTLPILIAVVEEAICVLTEEVTIHTPTNHLTLPFFMSFPSSLYPFSV